MAKHNIQATSTLCGASGHSWVPGLASNYRQCGQCRTVEVLIDGQWVLPTGRAKRVRSESAPALSWTQSQGLTERDLRATTTRLVSLPQPAVTSPAVSAGNETFQRMTRRNRGEVLFNWGGAHGYPELSFHLPSGRTHTIVSGVGAWRVTSFQCPLEVVEAAIDQAARSLDTLPELRPSEREKRLAVLEYGRCREWVRFTFKATTPEMGGYHFTLIIDGSEREWTKFAYAGRYEHVCQAADLLAEGGAHG
jgi:hypothetical protein